MNQKNTIIYFGMGCFTDTDVTVVKQLQKEYSVHWYVLHQPHDPYPVSFYADFVKNSLSENINYVDISHNIENVKTFFYGNNSIKTFVFSGNEVVLDDNVVNEINQNKDLYYINNSKATEP